MTLQELFEKYKEMFHLIHPETPNADLYFSTLSNVDKQTLVNHLEALYIENVTNKEYIRLRRNAYPKLTDQLDKIFHDGIDAWKAEIQEIKNRFPKS